MPLTTDSSRSGRWPPVAIVLSRQRAEAYSRNTPDLQLGALNDDNEVTMADWLTNEANYAVHTRFLAWFKVIKGMNYDALLHLTSFEAWGAGVKVCVKNGI